MEKLIGKRALFGLLLFFSLAANLFLGGLLLGHDGRAAAVKPRIALMTAMSQLSPDSRGKAQSIVGADYPAIRQSLKTVRADRQALRTLLAAPYYDHAKAAALMAKIRDEVSATQKQAQDMMLQIADQVTPAERAALTKALPAQME